MRDDSKPVTFTPFMPGTRSAYTAHNGGEIRVQWTPATGDAYLFDGCSRMVERTGVADMTIADAAAWAAEHVTANPCRGFWDGTCEECRGRTAVAEEDCGLTEVATDESVDAEEAEWAWHVAGLIAAAHERLAPLSGRWAVYRCGMLVNSMDGLGWSWAASVAKGYTNTPWVNEGDVEIRLNGERVVWF